MKKKILILSVATIAAIAGIVAYKKRKTKTNITPVQPLTIATPTVVKIEHPDITINGTTYKFADLQKYMPIAKNNCNFIVLYIQKNLNEIANTNLDPDGVFGNLTISALRNFENYITKNYNVDYSQKFLTGETITYENLYNLTQFFNQQN